MKIAGVTISGGGLPGGLDTQIQYNSGSVFAGVPSLTYDGTTLNVTGSFTGSLIGTASFADVALISLNQNDLPATIVMSFNNFK